jgi:hypothetical protein
MKGFLEFLSSVNFDTILLMVSAAFVAFAHMFLASAPERDGDMAAVLRKWIAVLDAIPPAKQMVRNARPRKQKPRPSPAE